MPWLAALLCCSPFDLAVHDAYGNLHGRPTYETYSSDFMNRDLAAFLEPAMSAQVSFRGKFPSDYLASEPAQRLVAWHLVGGLDPLDRRELNGDEPRDGYPVLLESTLSSCASSIVAQNQYCRLALEHHFPRHSVRPVDVRESRYPALTALDIH
jgi:hypothetical protein